MTVLQSVVFSSAVKSEAIDQSFDIPDPGVEKTVTTDEIADMIERCARDGTATIVARAQSRPA